MYYLYILECKNKSLYTGITTNIERRLKEHKEGVGSRYTKAHKAVGFLYVEKHKNRSEASKREIEIKKWPRSRKLELIENSL